MCYFRYLTIHKVHMHVGAIKQSLYGCTYVREIIHSLKLVDYLPVHTHKPYNDLHFVSVFTNKKSTHMFITETKLAMSRIYTLLKIIKGTLIPVKLNCLFHFNFNSCANYLNGTAKNWQKVAYLRRNPSPSVKWKTIA